MLKRFRGCSLSTKQMFYDSVKSLDSKDSDDSLIHE